MSRIFKYPFKLKNEQAIELPDGATVLHVGLDPVGQPCLWAEVNPAAAMKVRALFVLGTGFEIPPGARVFIGTFISGPLVWHVFHD